MDKENIAELIEEKHSNFIKWLKDQPEMPIREIIMWTAYHVEHHNETLKKNY